MVELSQEMIASPAGTAPVAVVQASVSVSAAAVDVAVAAAVVVAVAAAVVVAAVVAAAAAAAAAHLLLLSRFAVTTSCFENAEEHVTIVQAKFLNSNSIVTIDQFPGLNQALQRRDDAQRILIASRSSSKLAVFSMLISSLRPVGVFTMSFIWSLFTTKQIPSAVSGRGFNLKYKQTNKQNTNTNKRTNEEEEEEEEEEERGIERQRSLSLKCCSYNSIIIPYLHGVFAKGQRWIHGGGHARK